MANAIVARFPLGVYQGHRADGSVEELPSAVRLFSALVSAASRGITAEPTQADLRRSPGANRALAWIESHPPDGVVLPDRRPTTDSQVISYRQEGVIELSKEAPKRPKARIAAKTVGGATALNGSIGWVWSSGIPAEIVTVLDDLCADVGYFGESDSPATLEVADAVPTHVRIEATAFNRGGVAFAVPVPGRLDVLDATYRIAVPNKAPTASADKHSLSAKPGQPSSAGDAMTTVLRYMPPTVVRSDAPWNRALVLPAELTSEPEDHVRWCVALHRALASRLGDDAPAIVTGRYAAGAPRPANRVAIQFLDRSLVQHLGLTTGAFVILLPTGIEPEDVDAIRRSVGRLRSVYLSSRHEAVLSSHQDVDASEFWPATSPGSVRLWRSATALVPETRRQPGVAGRPRSLADAALLSAAFLVRDKLAVGGNGAERYTRLIAAVEQRGVQVLELRRLADSRVDRYVHKLPEGVTAQPYLATMDLGDLWNPRALVALGQARHLGGGLMVPFDVPEALAQSWDASRC